MLVFLLRVKDTACMHWEIQPADGPRFVQAEKCGLAPTRHVAYLHDCTTALSFLIVRVRQELGYYQQCQDVNEYDLMNASH